MACAWPRWLSIWLMCCALGQWLPPWVNSEVSTPLLLAEAQSSRITPALSVPFLLGEPPTSPPRSAASTLVSSIGRDSMTGDLIQKLDPKPLLQIGVLLADDVNSTSVMAGMQKSLQTLSNKPGASAQYSKVSLEALSNPDDTIWYFCSAIEKHNLTAMIAVGDQNTINTINIISKYLGIPILGYNLDRHPADMLGERPLYLQLDPSKALLAKALVKLMESNSWNYASLITEDGYAKDGFVETFLDLTHTGLWRVEDHIHLSAHHSDHRIDYKLLNLLENQSRLVVLHCSPQLALRVFRVAEANGFIGKGYAWFVTEDVVTHRSDLFHHYPVGLVSVRLDHQGSFSGLLEDSAHLVASATERYLVDAGLSLQQQQQTRYNASTLWYQRQAALQLQRMLAGRNCDHGRQLSQQHRNLGDGLYRYLRNTTVVGKTGILGFDRSGMRTSSDVVFYNLRKGKKRSRWRLVGSYRNDTLQLQSIVWPGSTISGPETSGQRTLRVVTNIVEPFVMEQDAIRDRCSFAVTCLEVRTKDKETLDDIFKDYSRHVHNESRFYKVKCCQGLSIMLLEKLARDLNFRFHLYITSDQKYGNQENGTWNGLVGDIQRGGAHMAVAAFSITRSRSYVIDFTHPYFYSGFSILVSERKRKTPIYAFMEPFDSWVWISIVVSATVVAVALSLLEWNSPFGLNPWGRKRKTNYTLGSGLNMVYAILFQHTIKTKSPKAWPSKWLQNFWAGVSIFIYSSYTANLAAFLAGKNSGVTVTGIHDPKLLDWRVSSLASSSVGAYLQKIDPQIYSVAHKRPAPSSDAGLNMLMNETIDAYLDDSPVLEFARTTMDAKCQLRLVGQGFGEDAYGIGLPKDSWLKEPLSQKIMQYHQSGYIEDLKDLYFRRSRCKDMVDGQLQGEASSMEFGQHAGLYLLLVVGIVVCVLLMFLEHATFKWMVPYWRSKPNCSFWKSLAMMFWSQRLYRIITSEELVSPHHSAREMIEVVKNRDFTKLFQKSVKKQEKQARNRKNLFSIVEQLQWKQRRDERLGSQQPSTQTDGSQDSDNSATPVNLGRETSVLEEAATTDTGDEGVEEWPRRWPGGWAKGATAMAAAVAAAGQPESPLAGPSLSPQTSPYKTRRPQPGLQKPDQSPRPCPARNRRPFQRQAPVIKYEAGAEALEYGPSKSDDELLQVEPLSSSPGRCQHAGGGVAVDRLVDVPEPSTRRGSARKKPLQEYSKTDNDEDIGEKGALTERLGLVPEPHSHRRFSNPGRPLLGQSSSSEDNLLSYNATYNTDYLLPNGMVILSANGDIFARNPTSGKNILVRPKASSNFETFSTNLPRSMKALPRKENRVKPGVYDRSRTGDRANLPAINKELEAETSSVNLDHFTKKDLFLMWKSSEKELGNKLKTALKDKADLQQKLASCLPETDT